MNKDLYKLNERILTQIGDTKFVTHSHGAFGKYFNNFNAAYKDLTETYCYNLLTGKKLSKKECDRIKSTQTIINLQEVNRWKLKKKRKTA